MVPHIEKVKKEKSLTDSKKSLTLWDAFKAQSTQKVKDALSTNKIESVMVPRNMTAATRFNLKRIIQKVRKA